MSVVARSEPADRPAGGTEALTDLGNAERFVAAHGHRFRYVHEWGRWLEWRDGRWRDDTTGEATRAAKTTARALLAEAAALGDSDARSRLAKWGATSQAEPRIRALLTLACTEPEVAISAAQLDQHPFALACANGTIDLRTGKLRAPDPADLITRGTDVVYEPDADCSRWRRFLAEVFAGDVELIGFVQRFVGYCLTGDTREQVLPVFHGAGANGKTTLVETLGRLLDDLAATAPFDTFLRGRDRGPSDDLARLAGARLVTANESGDGRRFDEAVVKQITGGDTIACRHLYGRWFEYRPQFKVVLVTNDRPRVSGDDEAVWRRLRLVPFEQSFRGREDRALAATLAAELPAILAWAVEGCQAWQREGLGHAQAVTRATDDYRTDEDVLGAFLADCCEQNGEVAAKDLRAAYEQWCAEQGELPLAGNALGRRLARRGIQGARRTGGTRVYVGIALSDGSASSDGTSVNLSIPARTRRVSGSAVTNCHPSPNGTLGQEAKEAKEAKEYSGPNGHNTEPDDLDRAERLLADNADMSKRGATTAKVAASAPTIVAASSGLPSSRPDAETCCNCGAALTMFGGKLTCIGCAANGRVAA